MSLGSADKGVRVRWGFIGLNSGDHTIIALVEFGKGDIIGMSNLIRNLSPRFDRCLVIKAIQKLKTDTHQVH